MAVFRRCTPVLGVALAVVLLTIGMREARPALAVGPVDQQYLGPFNSNTALFSRFLYAQTFTAGRTGLLDQVALFLGHTGSPGPLTVQIQPTSGGLPTGAVLATATVAESAVPADSLGWVLAPLAPPPLVLLGQQYAIVLSSGGDGATTFYTLLEHDANPYAGGAVVTALTATPVWSAEPNLDLLFQTFVSGLSVAITADVTPKPIVPSGQPLAFEFVVTNTGQAPLTGTTFGATLPAGLKPVVPVGGKQEEEGGSPCLLTLYGQRVGCNIGTLFPGQSVFITINATMNFVTLGTNLCATGQVNTGPAPLMLARTATACTRVGAPVYPDLIVTGGCPMGSGVPSNITACLATVTNVGMGPAVIKPGQVLLSLVGTMPAGFTSVSICGSLAPFPYGGSGLTTNSDLPASIAVAYTPAFTDTILPGQSRVLPIPALCALGGPMQTMTVALVADPNHVILESREDNNTGSYSVQFP